nr:branched-chain amino acid transport system II carrier protein [Shewanella maritima]
MQTSQMTLTDTLGLGFMTFAFFLGAGNLIFPPFAGMMAGENMSLAMLGFLITAVGLPLVGLIAVAKAKGEIMAHLPVFAATALAVAIYIIIGPAFAAPRTGLVAYEIGAVPFLSNPNATTVIAGATFNISQLVYSIVFFGIVMLLSLFPGKLLDNVGKVLTPILIILLVGLALSVMFIPGSEVGAPVGDYQANALTKGFLEGYNTMDTLASLMFGMLIIDLLRKKGVEDTKLQTKYLIRAALIAAGGLAFVYVSLFFLGATAGDLAAGADNGGVILTNYVTHEFGTMGTVLLSTVVTLACLTTAVGLVSACSDFFNDLQPRFTYSQYAVFFSVVSATIANVGLAELISISVPVLMTIYPVAIALVLVTLVGHLFPNQQFAHRAVLAVALFFGIFDGIKAAGFEVHFFDWVPLQSQGMAWVIPTTLMMIASLFIGKKQTAQ